MPVAGKLHCMNGAILHFSEQDSAQRGYHATVGRKPNGRFGRAGRVGKAAVRKRVDISGRERIVVWMQITAALPVG
jgi:hypothetical protein